MTVFNIATRPFPSPTQKGVNSVKLLIPGVSFVPCIVRACCDWLCVLAANLLVSILIPEELPIITEVRPYSEVPAEVGYHFIPCELIIIIPYEICLLQIDFKVKISLLSLSQTMSFWKYNDSGLVVFLGQHSAVWKPPSSLSNLF